MRRLAVALLLAATLAPLVPAQAEDPLLQDGAGDTAFVTGAPGTAPAPLQVAGQSEAVDLTALHVDETDETFAFVLHVAKLEGNPGGQYEVYFTWRDTEYRAVARRFAGPFGNSQFGWLEAREDDDWDRMAPLEAQADIGASMITIHVPKVYVLDGDDRAPGLGDAIDSLFVRAHATTLRISVGDEGYPASFTDSMPDDEKGAAYAFRLGDFSVGHLALTTEDRVRVSNGGATTFVFKATLQNAGEREDEVTLTLADLPPGWNGTLQSPLRVPARGERTVTILASVPFEHDHGGHDSFQVVAQSGVDSNARATLRLGVLHTPIPQPAGHHPDLYLHGVEANGGFANPFRSVFPFTRGFLNTDSNHEGDPASVTMNVRRSDEGAWRLPLNPALRMGLDFQTDKTGTLVASIRGGTNGEATVRAVLELVTIGQNGDRDGTVLAESDEVKILLDAQKPTPFTLTITPTEDADYVEYAKERNLELTLFLEPADNTVVLFGPQQPLLTTADFKLTLPLNEYHDRLTGLGEVEEGLQLVADGAVEKIGRPASVMTYAFDLKNGAGRDVTIDLDAAGADARLGVVVPAGSFELPAGASKRVTLAVQIPGDATSGEQIEVLLFAHAQEDPSLTAIVRTLTTVSTGANAAEDETEILLAARDAEHDTPAFTASAALAAVAVALLALRRK